MELLLLKDVDNVGRKGDVVRVRSGHGRNFLIPNNLALPATRANKAFFEEQRARSEARKAKEREGAKGIADQVSALSISITVKAGENNKLFGSVTSEQIAEEINKHNFEFQKKQIRLKESLKTLGSHIVEVEVYPQVKANLTVELVAESSPSEEESEEQQAS